MKRALLALAPLAFAVSAHADPVEVSVPADTSSQAAATAYTDALLSAVDKVCREETGPRLGVGYWTYLACKKATTEQVAFTEPTGLLAARLGLKTPVELASK
jgi:hypothetical protein